MDLAKQIEEVLDGNSDRTFLDGAHAALTILKGMRGERAHCFAFVGVLDAEGDPKKYQTVICSGAANSTGRLMLTSILESIHQDLVKTNADALGIFQGARRVGQPEEGATGEKGQPEEGATEGNGKEGEGE